MTGSPTARSIERDGDKLARSATDTYERIADGEAEPRPAKWAGLIGEYGWDHNTLVILEKDGKLYALIEWFFLYPLKEESGTCFKFPESGLYPGEKLIFTRDKDGRATQVEAASVVFERRQIDGENGKTFRIKPMRPMDELRKAALTAKPPEEKGDFRKPDLVDLTKLDDSDQARHPLRHGQQLPRHAVLHLRQGVHAEAGGRGAGARPQEAGGAGLWPVDLRRLSAVVGDEDVLGRDAGEAASSSWPIPAQGSRHNRGCAVDLTLYDRKTGKPVEMVGGYDEMSDRSYPDYLGGTSLQRWHRDLLRCAMQAEGFTVYEAEWWHFDYKDWQKYPIGTLTFEEIESGKK